MGEAGVAGGGGRGPKSESLGEEREVRMGTLRRAGLASP